MKNLFNNMLESEKQRILEMHGIKRTVLSEAPTDTSLLNFCTKCNEKENICGKNKMSPDTVNKFSAELVSIFGGGAPKKGLLGLGGKDYSRVVDIFKQMENEANFLDFCSLSKQFGNGNNVLTLCETLNSKLDSESKRKVLYSLNILVNSIQPCGGGKSTKRTSTPKKQTTPQKPNPIKTDKEIYQEKQKIKFF
jgi:hypothetical protein